MRSIYLAQLDKTRPVVVLTREVVRPLSYALIAALIEAA